MTKKRTLQERVWAKVKKGPGCWVWQGGGDNGHGRITVHEAGKPDRRLAVHRLTYEWAKGPIPPGFTIDHLCRNPICVRPKHLEAVTNAVNIQRIHSGSPMGVDQQTMWVESEVEGQQTLWDYV